MLHSKAVNMDSICVTFKSCQRGFDFYYHSKAVYVDSTVGVIEQGGWNSVSLCFVLGFCSEVIDFCWLIMLLAICRCC